MRRDKYKFDTEKPSISSDTIPAESIGVYANKNKN